MNKLLTFAIAVLLSGTVISASYAGSVDAAASKTGNSQSNKAPKSAGNGSVIKEKSAYSVDEQYKKRVLNKKKAAVMRRKLMKESQQQKAR